MGYIAKSHVRTPNTAITENPDQHYPLVTEQQSYLRTAITIPARAPQVDDELPPSFEHTVFPYALRTTALGQNPSIQRGIVHRYSI